LIPRFIFHFFILATFYLLPTSLQAQLSGDEDCQEVILSAEITPACTSGQDGEIRLTVSQGLPPYRVQWDDGSRKMVRTVSAGSYQVTITDALGCSSSGNFKVKVYAELRASTMVKNTSKPGKSNGSIEILVSGGTPPYHYSWIANNGFEFPPASPDLQQLKKLPAGFYKIVIFDAGGCYYEVETEVN
jgi:hypothetical protein